MLYQNEAQTNYPRILLLSHYRNLNEKCMKYYRYRNKSSYRAVHGRISSNVSRALSWRKKKDLPKLNCLPIWLSLCFVGHDVGETPLILSHSTCYLAHYLKCGEKVVHILCVSPCRAMWSLIVSSHWIQNWMHMDEKGLACCCSLTCSQCIANF